MNLRNYTSGVPVERSISAIEKLLVQAGATHIAKFYDGQRIVGFMFQIIINHTSISFKLPSKPLAIRRLMEAEVKKPRCGTMQRVAEQAERTAWAILKDWVHIQVTMIQVQQAEALQIFLPYACINGTDITLFDKLKDTGFKQLQAGSERNT